MIGVDGYTFRARWLPCVLVATPAVLATASWLPTLGIGAAAALPLLAAMAVAVAQIARNKGRELQTRLWREWGGAPTTHVLRNGSERISRESLARYRRFIKQIVPDVKLPPPDEERAAMPGALDGRYSAVTTALINRTQNKTEYARLYSENVTYGYWRNLRALRSVGIGLALVALLVAGARLAYLDVPTASDSPGAGGLTPAGESVESGKPEDLQTPVERGGLAGLAVLTSIAFLIFFTFKLNDELVRRAGFNYADRLVEASEQILATKEKTDTGATTRHGE